MKQHPHRTLGAVTIGAAALSLLGLLVGLSAASYDFEAFSSSESYIALGADAAPLVAAGLWLTVFGSYLLVLPAVAQLWRRHRDENAPVADLAMAAGAAYIVLGAAGGAVLASVHPDLLRLWSAAAPEAQSELLVRFDLVRRIAEDGLQGVVQNVAGATFFLGAARLMRPSSRGAAALASVIGSALVLSTVGTLADVEMLRLVGLTGTVLLAPVWWASLGVHFLRRR
jgi:hypothetical protein